MNRMISTAAALAAAAMNAVVGTDITAQAHAPVAPRIEGDTGVERAARRLAAKRKANKLIPDTEIYTRQRRRANERRTNPKPTPAEVHRINIATRDF